MSQIAIQEEDSLINAKQDEYIIVIKKFEKIDEYMSYIKKKYEKDICIPKKQIKIQNEDFILPSFTNYDLIIKYSYNIKQLKYIARNYKLKVSGIRRELVNRIYVYLKLSSFVIKIQKIFRGKLQRKYNFYHGPAFIKRNLCTNHTDFLSMEEINLLPYSQFFSYKDIDGFIYGFDIISLYNLIIKSGKKLVKNPYNRNDIPNDVKKNIFSLIRISKILNIHIDIEFENECTSLSFEKRIEMRSLELFQNIDYLGNYSNSQWFLSLNKNQLIKLMRELCDIWNFRAQLSSDIKRNICPPHGDPFRNFGISHIHNENDINYVKKYILEILEKFVNSGIDRDSKSLGCYYVLGALTLVNTNAAIALPWLFQSFSYL
jgi:hypothetical protein